MKLFELTIFGINLTATFYGLMYVLGFVFGYLIIYKRQIIPRKYLDDLIFYIFLGIVVGARLGYVIFYNPLKYIGAPLDIFKIWEGGMSFHGGVLGVIIAMYFFSKKFNFSFLKLADQITLILPIGLGFGRLGNYMNKELLGYEGYTGPFAVNLNGVSYFPSPLLEFLLEGIILFIILNFAYIKCKNLKNGQIAALFLIFYSIFRIFVEMFFREPDSNIGYIFGYFTMGEILSFPMLIIGLYYFFKLRKNA